MRMLVVDDEPLSRRALRRMLQGVALVDEAADADGARTAFDSVPYDAAVVDVCLGDQADRSGVELAREERVRGWGGALILVSGIVGSERQRYAAESSADGFLTKPVSTRVDILEIIESHARSNRRSVPWVDGLTEELRVRVADVRELARVEQRASAAKEEARGARTYSLALLAATASRSRDPSVMQAVALAVGVTDELLRQHAVVACRWPSEELGSLLIVDKVPISHLKEIAHLPRSERAVWTRWCVVAKPTVRQLRDALSKRR